MSVLTMENVSYTYKNKYQSVFAVQDVSFEFELGKVYAIIGKSGSGKTTMLSLLAGLDLPTGGKVIYNGTCTADMNRDKYRRREIAVIYQTFNLFPLLTALENVMYPLELEGMKASMAKERAKEMIKSVGLQEVVYTRLPSMLSGGERQRIAIARGIATDAKIILADEPTGNLDVENSKKVIHLLAELAHTKNYCVIIVTHDMAVADEADEVIQMTDGKLSLT